MHAFLLEICSRHSCKYKGERCLVDDDTLKPYCKCVEKCDTSVSTMGSLPTEKKPLSITRRRMQSWT